MSRISEGSVIFSDNGSAFTPKQEQPTLSQYAGLAQRLYPSVIHHLLSPNDNSAHRDAKQKWRQSQLDRRDDVRCSLTLLSHVNTLRQDTVAGYFSDNYFLAGPVTLERARGITSHSLSEFTAANDVYRLALLRYERYTRTANTSRHSDVRGSLPKSLECDLDGDYWTKYG